MSAEPLAVRAAKLANGSVRTEDVPPVPDAAPEQDDEDFAGGYPTPEQVPVHVAWHRVMCDVRAIAKNRRVTSGPAKFAFRGIEDVVQAFSASVRRHGVIVAPSAVVPTYTTSSSKQGTVMRECSVVCNWTVVGPMGDVLPVPLQTAGEAADYSDKATTKAQSIAQRTLLLVLGMVATDDPEPEAQSAEIERGDPGVSPQAYLAEITNPYTPKERFRQIYNELGRHRLLGEVVEFEGESGTLQALYAKIGNERWPKPTAAESPQQQALTAHTGAHDESDYSPSCAACIAEQAEADRQAAQS